MPTKPYRKILLLWGDSRITTNITEAEAFHTWAENEGISHRFDVDMDKLWLTVYATSPAQIESCNDMLFHIATSCMSVCVTIKRTMLASLSYNLTSRPHA